MVNIVLVEPEIPQNCGNIARTCAATRSRLHLVEPLGFDVSDRAVKRAGLDYWPMVDVTVYPGLDALFARNRVEDLWLATTKAPRDYTQADFRDGCWLFFGKETAGLPEWFRVPRPVRGGGDGGGKRGAVVSSGLTPERSESREAPKGADGFCAGGGVRTASRTGAA